MTDATETTNEIQTNLSNPDKPWLFQKGQSGNPLGRPKGSKNKISQLIQDISDEDQQIIADRIVQFAKNGGWKAFVAVLPYILPKPKQPNPSLIEADSEVVDLNLDSAEDKKKAKEFVIKQMIAGKLSASEARDMCKIVEGY